MSFEIGGSLSNIPLYSRKLHMRVLLARTSCETSLMILALSLGERVVNHFANRLVNILLALRSFFHGGRRRGNLPLCLDG